MNAGKLALVVSLSAVASFAAPTYPIPNSSFLGIDQTIFVPSNSPGTTNGYNYGSDLGLGGGEFAGVITNSLNQQANVAFWCVDDQLFFQPGTSSSFGDIVPIANISSTSAAANVDVRYGSLFSAGGSGWTNDLGAGNNNPYARYNMAAYLVTQFTPFDTAISNTQQNVAIEEAIWAITNNNIGTAQNAGHSAIGPIAGNTSVGFWVNQAETNWESFAASPTAQKFAVVSWGAMSTGTLLNGSYSSDGALQTFLVELPVTTPEPGFYGAMALGLSGLLLIVNRRKKKA
ncbi:MAG TPA: hypothetical protein VKB79_13555 [Bryobacteraceae bacterium]|nr:hypothetical protein [Bryobacteraceae bacterium]